MENAFLTIIKILLSDEFINFFGSILEKTISGFIVLLIGFYLYKHMKKSQLVIDEEIKIEIKTKKLLKEFKKDWYETKLMSENTISSQHEERCSILLKNVLEIKNLIDAYGLYLDRDLILIENYYFYKKAVLWCNNVNSIENEEIIAFKIFAKGNVNKEGSKRAFFASYSQFNKSIKNRIERKLFFTKHWQ